MTDSLTRVAVVGNEEGPLLHVIADQVKLQHVRVVPHVAALDVDRRLLLPAAIRVPGRPLRLVQTSLCVEKPGGATPVSRSG